MKPSKQETRKQLSPVTVFARNVAGATLSILVGTAVLVGCAKKNTQSQQQAQAPAPTATPTPAPTPVPTPTPRPGYTAELPPPNEDIAAPVSNVGLYKTAINTIGTIAAELEAEIDGETVTQPITFTVSTHSPAANVDNAYMTIYSSGRIGDIRISRYLNLEKFFTYPSHGQRVDKLVLYTHQAKIPSLAKDHENLTFQFELRLKLLDLKQVDPAQSKVKLLGCGSSSCSAERVPPGTRIKLNDTGRR